MASSAPDHAATAAPDGARRVAASLRTPGDLRPRRPAGEGVRAARAFAFDVARPRAARTVGDVVTPADLPEGVLPNGRGVAAEQPAMPQTGALAAYAALLARKAKAPRDVPVRGLPLVVRRRLHAEEVRLPGGIVATLAPEDAKVPPNAARAPRRGPRPGAPGAPGTPGTAGAPQPAPRAAAPTAAAQQAARRGAPQRRGVPRPTPNQARREPGAATR